MMVGPVAVAVRAAGLALMVEAGTLSVCRKETTAAAPTLLSVAVAVVMAVRAALVLAALEQRLL